MYCLSLNLKIYNCTKHYLSFILKILEQVFIEIKKMREQIKEIYGMLKLKSGVASIPDDFPIEFPLKTREKLQLLENYLSSYENQNTVV